MHNNPENQSYEDTKLSVFFLSVQTLKLTLKQYLDHCRKQNNENLNIIFTWNHTFESVSLEVFL